MHDDKDLLNALDSSISLCSYLVMFYSKQFPEKQIKQKICCWSFLVDNELMGLTNVSNKTFLATGLGHFLSLDTSFSKCTFGSFECCRQGTLCL